MSANGEFVVFDSFASNLVSGISDEPGGNNTGNEDVFIRNLATGVTQLVSVTPNGTAAGSSHLTACTSRRFRRSVPTAPRFFLPAWTRTSMPACPITPAMPLMYVRDMQTGITQMVSVTSAGTVAEIAHLLGRHHRQPAVPAATVGCAAMLSSQWTVRAFRQRHPRTWFGNDAERQRHRRLSAEPGDRDNRTGQRECGRHGHRQCVVVAVPSRRHLRRRPLCRLLEQRDQFGFRHDDLGHEPLHPRHDSLASPAWLRCQDNSTGGAPSSGALRRPSVATIVPDLCQRLGIGLRLRRQLTAPFVSSVTPLTGRRATGPRATRSSALMAARLSS